MACHSPLSVATKWGLVQVSCKQCLPCRISRQSALSLRAIFESRTTLSGEFWTLTYADAPEVGDYRDFQNFLKRLREWNRRRGNPLPIRYLACGEYGSKTGRFHFHALIFNGLSPSQETLATQLWPHGFVYIGTVTPASVRYTARYTLKFSEKGREAVAAWSKNPPLGYDGATELGRYLYERGDCRPQEMTHLELEGRSYTLDATMRKAILDAWAPGPEPHPLQAVIKRHIELKLGDPVAAQKRRQAQNQTFWETARLANEKL